MAKNPIDNAFVEIPNVRVNFDPESLDQEIRNQGVRLVHYAAIRCPVGMTDLDDNRRPHEDHVGCSNGFFYTKVGRITGLMYGNSKTEKLTDVGFVHGASFTTTFPRFYDDCAESCPPEPFFVAPFDRFYLEEESIVVPTWQLVRSNEAGSEKLNFPAVAVKYVMDSRGNTYRQDQDFVLVNGQIVWIASGRRPSVDLETRRGEVISVRYYYRPFWYCSRMLHEIRVTQVEDLVNNTSSLVRMPQQALLNREFLYLNESQDDETRKQSPRQQQAPEEGGFGPR